MRYVREKERQGKLKFFKRVQMKERAPCAESEATVEGAGLGVGS